jgi:DNA-binding cell septation regulator SpoVG
MYILSDIYVISVVDMLKCLNDHAYGVFLSMPSSSMVDSEFEHAALRNKIKDVLLRIRIICNSGATSLPMVCCFNELGISKYK